MFGVLDLAERSDHWTIAELQALVHPEDMSLEAIARLAAERAGDYVDVEFRMRAADGRWVWLRKRAELVEDEETREPTLVGIAFDVTERKREAEASATADQRLRDAIEAISEAFVLWDSSHRLVLCNSKYRRLHNLSGGLRRRRRASRPCRAGRARPQPFPGRARGGHLRGAPAGRAMAAGQRAAHPRRRIRVGRNRHHRAQGA